MYVFTPYVGMLNLRYVGMLNLKKYKDTKYVIGWKSKGLFISKLRSLHGACLPKILDTK